MTLRDPMVPIHHMLDHAREAVKMVRDRSRADLDADRQLNLALVRLVEVIGEAATRVPDDFRARHPQVPWRQAIGMRNRMIHGYDVVDFDILWAVLQHDLPPLIDSLVKIIDDETQPIPD